MVKKIIYLDQSFFSNLYKAKNNEHNKFYAIATRLKALFEKGLAVFPYSDMHDWETHSFKDNELDSTVKIIQLLSLIRKKIPEWSHSDRNELRSLSIDAARCITDNKIKELLALVMKIISDETLANIEEIRLINDEITPIVNKCKSNELWQFIIEMSGGWRFHNKNIIEEQQLTNAYIAFLSDEPSEMKIDLTDAIDPSIIDDLFPRGQAVYSLAEFSDNGCFDRIKDNCVEGFLNILPKWRCSTNSLDKDYDIEIKQHRLNIKNNHFRMLEKIENKYLFLKNIEIENFDLAQREKNRLCFLLSDYFKNIPYIDISAGLLAILKQEIKEKRFLTEKTNEANLKKEIRSIYGDIEHLSVFAPYCDAIFADKRMTRNLIKWKERAGAKYTFEVFSADTWDEFNKYLEEIECQVKS